ncbi:alpha/beta hydrolase-fold protein [Streptomyces eurythermus]
MLDRSASEVLALTRGFPTFQNVELMRLLQNDYRAGTARAIAGASTGGYGAMAMAARHPGAFGAAASYSGVLNTTDLDTARLLGTILVREGLYPDTLWGNLLFNLANWIARNPTDQAGQLRGTQLYVSQGKGAASSPRTRRAASWKAPCGTRHTLSPADSPPSTSRRPRITTTAGYTAGPTGRRSSRPRGRCWPRVSGWRPVRPPVRRRGHGPACRQESGGRCRRRREALFSLDVPPLVQPRGVNRQDARPVRARSRDVTTQSSPLQTLPTPAFRIAPAPSARTWKSVPAPPPR